MADSPAAARPAWVPMPIQVPMTTVRTPRLFPARACVVARVKLAPGVTMIGSIAAANMPSAAGGGNAVPCTRTTSGSMVEGRGDGAVVVDTVQGHPRRRVPGRQWAVVGVEPESGCDTWRAEHRDTVQRRCQS